MPRLRYKVTTADDDEVSWDFDGAWRFRRVAESWDETAEPPELEVVRDTWELRGQVVATPDGSVAGGWSRFRDLLAAFERRDNAPTKVEVLLVEDDGTETVQMTVGGDDYESFRWDEVRGDEPHRDAPRSTWLSTFPVTVVFSAVRRLADESIGGGGGTGVVGWEQRATYEWEAGLQRITWETTITTRRGVDAVEKARLYAVIPIDTLGESYAYKTNGEDGIDYTILDADARRDPARVPSSVQAVSRVEQYGVTVGNTGPGQAPDEVSVLEETTTTAEETVTVVTATARGPGAREFCLRFKPINPQDESTSRDRSGNGFAASWRTRTAAPTPVRTTIQAELGGGGSAIDYEPVFGDYDPVRFDGPRLPYEVTMTVVVDRRGGTGAPAELPFPPLLAAPWVLIQAESTETDPVPVDWNRLADLTRWQRTARLVYRSPSKPTKHPTVELAGRTSGQVASYKLAKGA